MSNSFFSLKNQQAYRITGIFFAKEQLANCKQSGIRPAVIVSNNRANEHRKEPDGNLPFHQALINFEIITCFFSKLSL